VASTYPVKPAPNLVGAACPNCGLLAWCVPAGMDSQQTERIYKLTEHQQLKRRGEFLHRAGTALKSLTMIRSGSVKSCITNMDGDEYITGFSFSGDLVGADAIDGGKYLYDVVALQESTACRISFGEFERLSRGIPVLQHHFNAVMGREITRNYGLMMQLGCMSAEQRVAQFLLNISGRYAARGYSSTRFHLHMSRREIASYLGLKHETVSRVFSNFRRDQLVAMDCKYTEIMNLGGLQEITGERQFESRNLHQTRSSRGAG